MLKSVGDVSQLDIRLPVQLSRAEIAFAEIKEREAGDEQRETREHHSADENGGGFRSLFVEQQLHKLYEVQHIQSHGTCVYVCVVTYKCYVRQYFWCMCV